MNARPNILDDDILKIEFPILSLQKWLGFLNLVSLKMFILPAVEAASVRDDMHVEPRDVILVHFGKTLCLI